MAIPPALRRIGSAFGRTKSLHRDMMSTPLQRCLSTFDLILIGLGNMVGAGVYILTGTVVRRKAGPGICVAYFIGGVVAFLNGLCYSELGSRVPRAGSAYSYTYVAMGEFLAFIIGWNIVLEYVIGAAGIARGLTGSLDALTSDAISNWTMSHVGTFYQTSVNETSPMRHIISHFPDLLSVLAIVIVAIILCLSANLSKHFNTVTTSVNVVVLIFATGVMLALADVTNWNKQPFMPFGFTGVLSGAATCFFAFIGFDAISISTEEAVTPQKSLPIATAVSVGITTVLLVTSSIAITLFEPWYLMDVKAAFTAAFAHRGIHWAEVITGIGSITGIIACLYCNNYAMPRVVYAMAQDGLIFRQLAYVTPLTQVPIVAIMFTSTIAAILALLLDIEALADFLSIGTLIAYSIVACCVIVMRYIRPARLEAVVETSIEPLSSPTMQKVSPASLDASPPDRTKIPTEAVGRLKEPFRDVPVFRSLKPGTGVILALVVFVGALVCAGLTISQGWRLLEAAHPALIVLLVFLCAILIVSFGAILMHEQDSDIDTFKVPAVPLIPCLALTLNVILIMQLQFMTWVRFFIWLLIGLVIYFAYGMHHSNENPDRAQRDSEKVPLASAIKLADPVVDDASSIKDNK